MKRADAIPDGRSLEEALEGRYNKPLSKLPDKLREYVGEEFFPLKWDNLDKQQRRSLAQQSDNTRNPAAAAKFAVAFYELDKVASLPKIPAIQAAELLLIRDGDLLKRLGLPCVDVEAPLLAHQLLATDEMRDGVDVNTLIATTYQPYAEWLRRARDKSIEYLPEHDLAVTLHGPKDSEPIRDSPAHGAPSEKAVHKNTPGPKLKVVDAQQKVRLAATKFFAGNENAWNATQYPAWKILNMVEVIREVWGVEAKQLPRNDAKDKDKFKFERKVNLREMCNAVNSVRPLKPVEN
jgi:hypothetical protein